MHTKEILEQKLLEKIKKLVPEQILLVENFIDSLELENNNSHLKLSATKMSESVFKKIWDNPDDAEYDNL